MARLLEALTYNFRITLLMETSKLYYEFDIIVRGFMMTFLNVNLV